MEDSIGAPQPPYYQVSSEMIGFSARIFVASLQFVPQLVVNQSPFVNQIDIVGLTKGSPNAFFKLLQSVSTKGSNKCHIAFQFCFRRCFKHKWPSNAILFKFASKVFINTVSLNPLWMEEITSAHQMPCSSVMIALNCCVPDNFPI